MKFEFSELIVESVKLELSVSELYLVFHAAFPEDNEFWWKLAIEEKNHASLLKNLENFSIQLSEIPFHMDEVSISELKRANSKVEKLVQEFKDSPPNREEAFNLAHELELSAGESHFQEYANDESGSQIAKIFKHLNQSDVDHAKRIKDYAENHGIQIKSI
jgi:ferritin